MIELRLLRDESLAALASGDGLGCGSIEARLTIEKRCERVKMSKRLALRGLSSCDNGKTQQK